MRTLSVILTEDQLTYLHEVVYVKFIGIDTDRGEHEHKFIEELLLALEKPYPKKGKKK